MGLSPYTIHFEGDPEKPRWEKLDGNDHETPPSKKINLCDIPTTKGQWEQLTPDAKKKEGKKNPKMRATPKRAKIPRKRLRPRANVESKSPRKHLK